MDAKDESGARTLADRARVRLHAAGIDDPMIDKLADRYVAEDRGEDLDAFVAWARKEATPEHEMVDEAGEQSFPASDPPSTWAAGGDRS